MAFDEHEQQAAQETAEPQGLDPQGPAESLEARIERARREHPEIRIDCYLLFSSHYDAMALYGEMRAAGLAARISTTPRDARSSCGVALLVPCEIARAANDLAAEKGIPLEGAAALPCQIDPHRDTYC